MKRLSESQLRMLERIRDGEDYNAHAQGMSEYGGAHQTLMSLVRRGLVRIEKHVVLTAAGYVTLRDLKRDR